MILDDTPCEPVIYKFTKATTRPGPRAQQVSPAPQGDLYSYLVDKFWIVGDVLADGNLVLRTRRGKQHIVSADDPNLRPARWWERLWYRDRFPGQKPSASDKPVASSYSGSPHSAN